MESPDVRNISIVTEMKIAIDADCNGTQLKETLLEFLRASGFDICDLNHSEGLIDCDYPDVALNMATKIQAGEFEKGILICGTGLGMAIVANKVPGVYAGACSDIYAAERLCRSNNAQVITLGAQVTGPESAKVIVRVFLESTFDGGRSQPKVEKIHAIESRYAAPASV